MTAGDVICCIPEEVDIYKGKVSLWGFTLLSQTENPYYPPDVQTSFQEISSSAADYMFSCSKHVFSRLWENTVCIN